MKQLKLGAIAPVGAKHENGYLDQCPICQSVLERGESRHQSKVGKELRLENPNLDLNE